MGVSRRHLTQVTCQTILKYGRLPPWRITLRRSRSCLIQFPEFQTSAVFLDTKSTAVDSLLLLGWRLHVKKSAEPSIPRKERSSGSMFVRNQASMSMVNHSVFAHQTRLVNMLSLELLPVIWSNLMNLNSRGFSGAVQRRTVASSRMWISAKLRRKLKSRN